MPILRLNDLPINKEGSYLVHHLIPMHDLTVVWGKPKSGKTFWVLDLAMHVAAGLRYRNKETVSGPVIYLTLEGGWEFGARAHAAGRASGADVTSVPFFCSVDRRTFTKVGGADGLIKEIQNTNVRPVLIVLDTLNRSLDGSENSDEDMTHYTKCAEAICDAFECAVIIIHHGRSEGDKPRGHTSLTGTAAAQLKITKVSAASNLSPQMMCTQVEFMKDGPEGGMLFSWLRPCIVGKNRAGTDIETCFIEEAPAPESSPSGILSPQARKALSVLQELLTEADDKKVRLQQWRGACDTIPLSKKRSGAKQAFWRALDALRGEGLVEIVDQVWVCMVEKKDEMIQSNSA